MCICMFCPLNCNVSPDSGLSFVPISATKSVKLIARANRRKKNPKRGKRRTISLFAAAVTCDLREWRDMTGPVESDTRSKKELPSSIRLIVFQAILPQVLPAAVVLLLMLLLLLPSTRRSRPARVRDTRQHGCAVVECTLWKLWLRTRAAFSIASMICSNNLFS